MEHETTRTALGIYRRIVNEQLGQAVRAGAGCCERRGIFSSAIVVWLMIFQRLQGGESLSFAVERLRLGDFDELLAAGSLPARSGRISDNTGGYSQARQRVSLEEVERIADALGLALTEDHKRAEFDGHKVYVIDSSTLRTLHSKKNISRYPQYKNQHGKAHYPLMRISIATNAVTGVVLRPAYGAFNGDAAVNELSLAEELLERIPSGSIVIGDRFYGCSRFADVALRAGHHAVVRVKERNAKKFIGSPSSKFGEIEAEWHSNPNSEGVSYSAKGRFIWHVVERSGFRPMKLILFTTSNLPRKQIVALYAQRWNVELDLRHIKSTMKMDMLYTKTPEMGAKELILGIAAYNLIRHLMVGFAKQIKTSPRQLSFTKVLNRVLASAPVIVNNPEKLERICYGLFSYAHTLRLPTRSKKRNPEPRKVWQKGQVAFMTHSRQYERKLILKKMKQD